MDILNDIYDLKEVVAHEIGNTNKRIQDAGGKINIVDVDLIDKLSHSIKSLVTTCAMLEAEEDEGGYSERYMKADGAYSGRKMQRGYSRTGETLPNDRGYSSRYSRNGYSRHGDLSMKLRQLMDEAPDEMTRMEIKNLMTRVGSGEPIDDPYGERR